MKKKQGTQYILLDIVDILDSMVKQTTGHTIFINGLTPSTLHNRGADGKFS